jgi:hypothetical protein
MFIAADGHAGGGDELLGGRIFGLRLFHLQPAGMPCRARRRASCRDWARISRVWSRTSRRACCARKAM